LSGWRGRWFDHQELRDDRSQVFCTYLSAGFHEYSYLARATTFGEFLAPPPKVRVLSSLIYNQVCMFVMNFDLFQVEEMYNPETFGRGSADTVHVVLVVSGC
jgi:uncharacterized protein YfaS (alpha-2-macroglobulin family)